MSIPYDPAYKKMFGAKEMIEHFAAFLPGDWHAAVQWDTLQLAPTERLGPHLQQRDNDLVWRVQRRDGSGLYIYLMLEFQSGVDRAMAVRVNTYTAWLIEEDWQRRKLGQPWRLPTVLPVVLYTGKQEWAARVELAPQWPPELAALQDYGQRLRYLLVTAGTAAQVPGERANLADGLFRIERAANREQLAEALNWMRQALAEAGNPAVDDAVLEWFNEVYIPSRARDTDVERLASWKETPKMLEQYLDSWTDALRAEGEAKGEARGEAKGEARGEGKGAEAGRKELLMKLVLKRFGADAAAAIAPLLEAVHSLPTLDEIGLWIVEYNSADALLAKVRAL